MVDVFLFYCAEIAEEGLDEAFGGEVHETKPKEETKHHRLVISSELTHSRIKLAVLSIVVLVHAAKYRGEKNGQRENFPGSRGDCWNHGHGDEITRCLGGNVFIVSKP